MPTRSGDPAQINTPGSVDGRRYSRRALVASAATSLLLTGCIVERPKRGPIVPTPTSSGAAAGSVPVGGAAGRWEDRDFRVVMAGDDVRESVRTILLAPFSAATGCRLSVGFVDYDDLASERPSADLALVSDRWARELDGMAVLSRLEPVGADESFPDLVPSTRTAIPAYGNAIVSAYRIDAVPVERIPPDWVNWWQSRALPASRTLAKGPYGTFEFSLLADGVKPGELYPLDLERAIAGLRRISGSIVDRWWETGPQVIDWLSGGRASLGSAMAHQVIQAQRAGLPVQAIWNQGLLVADYWVVPVASSNSDVADDFLRFARTAPAQAALATAASLSPVSSTALDLVDPLLQADLATGPANLPRLIRSNTEWWVDNTVAANDAFTSWLLGDPRGRG